MRLTLVSDGDWHVIERAEHDGREWIEPAGPNISTFRRSARISDADVEGSAAEMLAIAVAIRERRLEQFKRCAVDASREVVKLWSPRNSQTAGEVPYADALALAEEIERALAPQEVARG